MAAKLHSLDLREKYVFAMILVLPQSCRPGSVTLVVIETTWTLNSRGCNVL